MVIILVTNYDTVYLLYVPYNFLPQYYVDNNNFISQWLKLNQNKIVVINHSEIYHINKIVDYHTLRKRTTIGSGYLKSLYPKINLTSYAVIYNIGYDSPVGNSADSDTIKVKNAYQYVWCSDTLQIEKQLPPLINLTVNGARQGIWFEQHNNVRVKMPIRDGVLC